MNQRRSLLLALCLATSAFVLPACAEEKPPINVLEGGGVAMHGYDPVAYFADGRPRKGRKDLVVQHANARWFFASEKNKKRFEDNPQEFLPAYGGYCAYGVAQGYLVKIDPEAWKIVNGRLYLNYDRSVAQTWAKDIPGYVKKADENWPKLVKTTR